ncbi:hypothetical protein BGZ83_006454 [Gryganskiella cystojenkinii]|nr:hypothetical protein BGZ83_006454 [Gryganskiella cystojenkinii]
MPSSHAAVKKIAIVTCSTRKPRANPFISAYVLATLKECAPSNVTLSLLDIADQGLPFFDEPDFSASFPPEDPTPHYSHTHTRAWSTKIKGFDAFIFVTPEYNSSIPAPLKNAIDFLYYEWKGKPMAVVSYGARGGSMAANHLLDILGSLKMSLVETSVQLTIHAQTLSKDATALQSVPKDVIETWKEAGKEAEINKVLHEILQKLK